MRRLTLTLLFFLTCCGIATGTYFLARHVCCQNLVQNADDLTWLREEFHLNEGDMQRIRALHEGYLPQCHERCTLIAQKKEELQAALEQAQDVTPEVGEKLSELAKLRSQCQFEMLKHFMAVSKTMPPEQGKRYWAEMQRITLASHEKIEGEMQATSHSEHGHH